jgi:hypothetical protein
MEAEEKGLSQSAIGIRRSETANKKSSQLHLPSTHNHAALVLVEMYSTDMVESNG